MNILKEDFPLENIKVQYINVHTFEGGEVDVLPVQTNPLLLIPDDKGDGDVDVDVGDADEDDHGGKLDGVTHCVIVKSNSLL